MQQAPTYLVILFDLVALFSMYMAAWAYFRSKVPAAREFSLLNIAISIYTIGYAIEITRTSLPSLLDAIRFEYVGLAFIPALLLLFVIHFTRGKPPKWYIVLAVLIVPIITLGLVLTVEYHQWFYINPQLVQGKLFPVLKFQRGPWYIVNFVYLQTLTILSAGILFITNLRSHSRHRKQSFVVSGAAIIPILGALLYYLGYIPGGADPGPFTLTFTAGFLAFALFKLKLFELIPTARNLALDAIRDSLLVVDQNGRVQDFNKAALQLPGAEELMIGEVLPKKNILLNYIKPLLDHEDDSLEFSTEDGKFYFAKVYSIKNTYASQEGKAILISDITEAARLMRQLKRQAGTDELTGIYNRRELMQLGEHELKRMAANKLPLATILIDLDHFKLINDQYGHLAGDEVLRQVTRCFSNTLRAVDIFGRYGGEEFIIFLPGVELYSAGNIAQRLADQLAILQIQYEDRVLSVSASFGVHVIYPDENTRMDGILQVVDEALYRAKRNGRNQVVIAE